jgi:hypothetical protein
VVWENLNWLGYIVLLPLALFVMRWSLNAVAPVRCARAPTELPPVVQLVKSKNGHIGAYDALRREILSEANLAIVVALSCVFHIVDMWEELSFYFGRMDLTGAELDWAIMFVGTNLPKWQNLLLVMAAYPLQVFLVLILAARGESPSL